MSVVSKLIGWFGGFAIPGLGPALSVLWALVKPILNPAVWPMLLLLLGLAHWHGEWTGDRNAAARCNAAAAEARANAIALDLKAEKEAHARETADLAELNQQLETTRQKVKAYEDALASQPDSCQLDDADIKRLRDIDGTGAGGG